MQSASHSLTQTHLASTGTAVLESSQDLHMRKLSKAKPVPGTVVTVTEDSKVAERLNEAQINLEAVRRDLKLSIERTKRAMSEASSY